MFGQVEGMIEGVQGDKRLFTQRLFNRLMFVQFLQKKDWLRFGGSTNYLAVLREAARKQSENFYRDRLYWLFFYGLGTLNDSREVHNLEELRERGVTYPFSMVGCLRWWMPTIHEGLSTSETMPLT